eukprot:291323_1
MDELIVGSGSIVKKYTNYTEKETVISLYHKQFGLYQHTCTHTLQIASECKTLQHKSRNTFTHKRKHLVVFDWDDVIFPTHSLQTLQHQKDKYFISKFKILVAITENIFTEMIDLFGASNIIILTNAYTDWIDKCLNIDIIQVIFMRFQTLLNKHNIKIISASSHRIRNKYPTNYHKWKEIAFAELFKKHFNEPDTTNCITCIAHSIYEYNASDSSSKCIKN